MLCMLEIPTTASFLHAWRVDIRSFRVYAPASCGRSFLPWACVLEKAIASTCGTTSAPTSAAESTGGSSAAESTAI